MPTSMITPTGTITTTTRTPRDPGGLNDRAPGITLRKEHPMLSKLSDAQIEQRIAVIEIMITNCRDRKAVPGLNHTLQCLIEEQVRRDENPSLGKHSNEPCQRSEHDGQRNFLATGGQEIGINPTTIRGDGSVCRRSHSQDGHVQQKQQ